MLELPGIPSLSELPPIGYNEVEQTITVTAKEHHWLLYVKPELLCSIECEILFEPSNIKGVSPYDENMENLLTEDAYDLTLKCLHTHTLVWVTDPEYQALHEKVLDGQLQGDDYLLLYGPEDYPEYEPISPQEVSSQVDTQELFCNEDENEI